MQVMCISHKDFTNGYAIRSMKEYGPEIGEECTVLKCITGYGLYNLPVPCYVLLEYQEMRAAYDQRNFAVLGTVNEPEIKENIQPATL